MQTTTDNKRLNRIALFAIDAGNRNIKWIDYRGNPHILPSYSLKLEDWQDTPTPDAKSVIIEDESGRYAIGQIAKELGGQPTYQQDKTELAHLLILAAIAPIQGSELPIAIDRLRIALPDSRHREQLENLKKLEGVRTVTRNGIHLTYSIRKIEPIDEGLGAFRFAQNAKLFQYPHQVNGILDCGGGTTLAKLFNPMGNVLREGDLVLPGTYSLASMIATALTPKLGYSPDLGLIMDGICDRSFVLGTSNINFKKEFAQSQEKWVSAIRSEIKIKWSPFIPKLAEVLIVGGSAPVFKSSNFYKDNDRYKLAPNSQFIGVKGMLIEV